MSNAIQTTQPKSDLKSLINSEAVKAQIARCLPQHLTPERFLRVATTALLRVPKLAECDQASFMLAMLNCSALGLEPDGRRCHLIPFENRKLGIVECQLIIDYKGLIELAKRSGEVSTWQPFTVCERDVFTWKNGVVDHSINWLEDRGKVLAYYSQVTGKDGSRDYEVMTRAEVEAIRARSRAGNSGPWVTDFDEMGKKTVMRRHSKRLTLSPEFHDALDKDGDTLEERPAKARVVDPATIFTAPAIATAEPVEVTTEGEAFTLDAEVEYPTNGTPREQLDWLMVNNSMPASELFDILHGIQMPGVEKFASIDEMPEKTVKNIVKSWALILGERKGGAQ